MRISIYCNASAHLLRGEQGHAVGGMQVTALVFARALAKDRGHDVTFVVPNGQDPRSYRSSDLDVVEWPHGNEGSYVRRTATRALRHVSLTASFPWVRVHRWSWRLLWQLPVAGLNRLIFMRQVRRGYARPAVRSAQVMDADVACCFKPGLLTSSVVEGCQRAGRPVAMVLVNDTDLGDYVYQDSREWGPKWAPGHACWRSLAKADAVVVQTLWQQERLRERLGREGVLIRSPIDVTTLTDAEAPAETPYVLWVGRGDNEHKRPRKCYEVARLCPDVTFVMIMNPVSERQQAALKAEAPPNVRIVDYVPYEEIEAYFKHASLFVSTSGFEGFPNTFLQAGKYGVPIVVLRVDPDGFVERHGCGIQCEGSIERMAEEVRRFMADEQTRRTYGRAARQYVCDYHALDGRLAELEALLTSLSRTDQQGRASLAADRPRTGDESKC